MSAHSKRQFLDGAMALTLSTVLVKIIGLVYKIPLMRILGAEGMGYFNSAYELYTLFFVISTAGIPVAISIMISENIAAGRLKNAEKIFERALWLLLGIGFVGAVVMSFGARALAELMENEKATLSLVFVSPTVFLISVSGAVRGYFQGCRNMRYTAVSQIIEALGKLALGLVFASVARKYGCSVEKVAAFAILGLSVGTAVSTLYLCVEKRRSRLTLESVFTVISCDKTGETLSQLLKLALPVTLSSVLVSLTRIIDMYALLDRLPEEADRVSLYGAYSTMALPIYNLPSSLVAGISLALVPSISAAIELGQIEREKQLVASGVKLCSLVALPVAFGIGVYSKQILDLLFAGQNEAIEISAPLLSALGASVFASCIAQVTNSVLQANGKTLYPIFSMLCGLLVKGVAAYFLIGNPKIGAMGAPVSTLLCNTVAVTLNLWLLGKCMSHRIELSGLLKKPTACALLSVLASLAAFLAATRIFDSEKVAFLVAVSVCIVAYLACAVFCGLLDAEELEMLHLNKKIGKNKKEDVFYEQRRKNKRAFE